MQFKINLTAQLDTYCVISFHNDFRGKNIK